MYPIMHSSHHENKPVSDSDDVVAQSGSEIVFSFTPSGTCRMTSSISSILNPISKCFQVNRAVEILIRPSTVPGPPRSVRVQENEVLKAGVQDSIPIHVRLISMHVTHNRVNQLHEACICVDGTFYLVTSTFLYFPGVPVYTSTDLKNWTQIGTINFVRLSCMH
jgi:hypothetical protein